MFWLCGNCNFDTGVELLVFRDMLLCSLVDRNKCFGGTHCSICRVGEIDASVFYLKMKASSSKMVACTYKTTHCDIPEDCSHDLVTCTGLLWNCGAAPCMCAGHISCFNCQNFKEIRSFIHDVDCDWGVAVPFPLASNNWNACLGAGWWECIVEWGALWFCLLCCASADCWFQCCLLLVCLSLVVATTTTTAPWPYFIRRHWCVHPRGGTLCQVPTWSIMHITRVAAVCVGEVCGTGTV